MSVWRPEHSLSSGSGRVVDRPVRPASSSDTAARDLVVDPDAPQQTLVVTAFTILAVLALMLCSFKWFAGGRPAWPGLAVALVAGGMAIYSRRHRVGRAGAWALVVVMVAGLVFSGYASGAYDGAIVQLAPTLPAIAAMLLGPRAGWVGLGLTVLVLAALMILQLSGQVPANVHGPQGLLVARFVALVCMAAIVAVVAGGFVATNQRLLASLAAQAHTDPLTGLANRRALHDALVREAQIAVREGRWLSVLVVDIDWFKRFNDLNGHLAGDRCLQQVAEALRSAARRPGDVVARSGGEEFVIVLPNTDLAGARRVAQAIAAAVRGLDLRYRADDPQRLTVTIGASSAQGAAVGDGQDLLAHADSLLYRGKDVGRDRVVSAVLGSLAAVPRSVAY